MAGDDAVGKGVDAAFLVACGVEISVCDEDLGVVAVVEVILRGEGTFLGVEERIV